MQYNISSVGDSEKIFNLQLALSKLQEEVTLYRNGVDVPQLLELIREKDNEIESLKDYIVKSDEKSLLMLEWRAEMIIKQENMLNDIQQARSEKSDAINRTLVLEESMLRKELEIKSLMRTIDQLQAQSKEREDYTSNISANNNVLNGNVVDLQNKCANLIREKTELNKTFEKERTERTKLILEYRNQIDKSIVYNNEIKEMLEKEHNKGLEIAQTLKSKQRELSHSEDLVRNQIKDLEESKLVIQNLRDENSKLHNEILNYKLSANVKVTPSTPETLFTLAEASVETSTHLLSIDEAHRRISELEGYIRRQVSKSQKSNILRDKTNIQEKKGNDENIYSKESLRTKDAHVSPAKVVMEVRGNDRKVSESLYRGPFTRRRTPS